MGRIDFYISAEGGRRLPDAHLQGHSSAFAVGRSPRGPAEDWDIGSQGGVGRRW